MKITPSINGITKGKYDITVDNMPGAIEIRKINNELSIRIFAVSPKPYGAAYRPGFTGSSANTYILEKSTNLNAQTDNKIWVSLNVISLIWAFCQDYEIEVNPIEFNIAEFVEEAIK